ncbi:UPF0182 family protein [Microbacterium sp. SLBN-146]|uniref:UPF0182 family membrane protein n=1 Tax=Microbacterium sp. SLBN-146 TaxID=2768457 RepID=UPI0011535165|nr:UPF0182 family protein [Microbacterium sp. SLBN-146]TQJ31775.1 hypothetical protein FBY39_2257 [Microbacterium sp. SLBN-146]
MTTTSAPTQATPPRSRRIIAISLAIIAAIVVAFFVFANLYAEWLWYEQLGYNGVLLTEWTARVIMFVVGFLGMAIPVWLAIQLAYRLRPVYARLSSQLDRYQEVVEPLRRLAMWGIPIFFGFFAGFAASAQWQTTWTWLNGVATTETDPQFGLDTGFYMFAMPFYVSVVGYVSAVLLICLLVTALVSYLYGSVRIGQRELRISKSARIQLAVLAGIYLLVQGASLWLDRYQTLVEPGGMGRITGPGYTEVNAVIIGQEILAIAAVVVALLFFVTAVIGRWRFPLIGTGLLLVVALVLGVGYPWVVNTFQVQPNQLSLEREFYQRNLDGTKTAYGIDGLEKTEFSAETTAEAGQLREDAGTTTQIRIMDPAIIGPTVRQLEQYRAYYQFQNPLDVDRYEIDGEMQDTIVSVRELNMNQLGSGSSWLNETLVYTHGYGMVAAAGNERTADGNPVFLERGIPATGFLSDNPDFQPRVYFGEFSPEYSIVGAPEGTTPIELDYPSGSGDSASGMRTTFDGDGGPSVGNIFNRLIYALKFQSEQILFSDDVNEDSQILYDRDPRQRVSKVAPYLTLDSDPYPTVVDGRIKWVVDGYTLSANYPYSSTVPLSQAIADSNNTQPRFLLDDINYIRNSVKATVDAYDGSVTLYAWDPEDPVLKTWQNVYPTQIKPIADMSADLISHVRYPTDLFKVQRAMLQTYHVDDAQSFYERDNAWATPEDPQNPNQLQPPYYLTMQMPGQDNPAFSMFTTFIPSSQGAASRNVLMGYLAADSNAGREAGVKGEDYGKLRMLEIAAETTVPGPGQVQNRFDSDPTVSQQINVLTIGQSEVLNGNLLTLPVGGGLLYVQPVFVQAAEGTQLPQLRKVLVAFGDDIAFEDTLGEALDVLFGGDSGASTGDGEVIPDDGGATPQPTPEPTDPGSETPAPTPPVGDYATALEDARVAMADRQAALEAGDLTAFAEADERLTDAVERLLALSE